MNKIVSDAKDGSVKIIALSYNNLGDEASSLHMVNKETFEQTVAKWYTYICQMKFNWFQYTILMYQIIL